MRLQVRPAFPAKLEHAVAESSQERAIVGDEQHRAVVLPERIEQHLLGGEIEVVGRLVQDQEIRWIQQHARENEACLLTARQRADLLVDVVAGELKRAREIAEDADGIVGKVLAELFFDGEVGIEQVE